MLSNLPRVVQNVIIVDWSKISTWNCLSIRISHSEFCMQQCTCLLYTQKNSYCYFKAPGEPSNLSLVNRTDSTITLSWSKPVNQNGIIVKYTRIFVAQCTFTNNMIIWNNHILNQLCYTGQYYKTLLGVLTTLKWLVIHCWIVHTS